MQTGIAQRRKGRKDSRLLGGLGALARVIIVLGVLLAAPAARAQRLSAQPAVTNLAPTALFDVSVLTNATRYQSRAISLSNLTANVVSNGVRITAGTNVSSIQTNRTGGYLDFTINTVDTTGAANLNGGTNILITGTTNINLVGPVPESYVPSVTAASNALVTVAGTNLVKVGTTLSLSNAIINDATKWRGNATYTGGALVAGEAALWSSNGTLHITYPHGTAFTLASNGVILTNGTALAGGGGATYTGESNIVVTAGNAIAISNNALIYGIVATNATATSVPLTIDSTSTNSLASFGTSNSVYISTNGLVVSKGGFIAEGDSSISYNPKLFNGLSGSARSLWTVGRRDTGNQIYQAFGYDGTRTYMVLGTSGWIGWDESITAVDRAPETYFWRRAAGEIVAKTNFTSEGTITATNGYINPVSALPSSGVLWVNFNPTNQWQSNSVTGAIEIALTNITAGASRQVRLECASGGPHAITWTHAFNNATDLPGFITNGNVYVIAFDAWGPTTNELTGAGRFFR